MKTIIPIAEALIKQKKTLSIAESCTGGLLCNKLTNISGASTFLQVGIIAYTNETKIKILKVKKETILKYGAVSEQVAIEMAQGVRKIHQSDFAISITGIAGPTGGTKRKPVGLTYICLATKEEILCLKCLFEGSRLQIKNQVCTQSLKLLAEFL